MRLSNVLEVVAREFNVNSETRKTPSNLFLRHPQCKYIKCWMTWIFSYRMQKLMMWQK